MCAKRYNRRQARLGSRRFRNHLLPKDVAAAKIAAGWELMMP
jgi:hypothetical protein